MITNSGLINAPAARHNDDTCLQVIQLL